MSIEYILLSLSTCWICKSHWINKLCQTFEKYNYCIPHCIYMNLTWATNLWSNQWMVPSLLMLLSQWPIMEEVVIVCSDLVLVNFSFTSNSSLFGFYTWWCTQCPCVLICLYFPLISSCTMLGVLRFSKATQNMENSYNYAPWIFGLFCFVIFRWNSKDEGENIDLFTECF